MKQLTGPDAMFLHMELKGFPMHIGGVSIYDQSTSPGGLVRFKDILAMFASRLDRSPIFRRKLAEVPFNLDQPYWVDDPDFDLEFHVRHIALPKPGDWRQLCIQVARLHARPLDRNRPLWEAYIIEGLNDLEGVPPGSFALYLKVHHAAIDGASGAEIMTEMYDLSPEGRDLQPEPVEPERIPTDQELLTYAALSKMRLARDSFGLVKRTVENVSSLVRAARVPGSNHGAVPLTAPRAPWNHSIGPHRTVSFARLPLERAKAVKDALGVKMNDVILAMCAGTLRKYLEDRGELPGEPLIATCPVSVRVDDEKGSLGNKVSAMFASLATDIADPAERLAVIAASTGGAKSDHDLIGARTLTDWAEWAAPRTFGLAARLYGSMNESLRPVHNLVISNVPGPPFPLYLGGAELVAAYPMGPIMDGAGLNITVLSYRDHIDIGFMADRELVPDVWDLAAAVEPAFDELVSLAETRNPTLVKSAAPVTATSKAAQSKTAQSKAGTRKSGSTKTRSANARPAKTSTMKTAAKKSTSTKSSTKKTSTKKTSTRKTAAKASAKKTATQQPTSTNSTPGKSATEKSATQ